MTKKKGPSGGGPGSHNSNFSESDDSTFSPRKQREFDSDHAWLQRNPNRPYWVRRATQSDAFFDEYCGTDPSIEKWLVIRPDTSWQVITVLSGGRR